MIRHLFAVGMLGMAALSFSNIASAQSNNALGGALLGGAAGAIIGGAAGHGAGGAVAGGIIGAAGGAIIGSQFDSRPGGYYWGDGRCWRRNSRGDYYRVSRRYCG